jgi:hypothetical protein
LHVSLWLFLALSCYYCSTITLFGVESYNTKSTCIIPADKDHFSYWRNHKLQVIGIVYDPNDDCGYWVNISSYIRNNISTINDGPYRINYSKTPINKFDKDGFRDFFLPIFIGKPIIIDYERSVEFANSQDQTVHYVGIRSLFYGYRNEERAWDVLENILKERPTENTDKYLAHIFAHIIGHGDIWWNEYNTIDENIKSVLRRRYRNADQELIIPLLRMVEDNNFERGSIGQDVYAIIDLLVSNGSMKLLKIINNKNIELSTRVNGLYIYCLIEQENAENQLEKICELDKELSEWASHYLNYLKKEGFFYI